MEGGWVPLVPAALVLVSTSDSLLTETTDQPDAYLLHFIG